VYCPITVVAFIHPDNEIVRVQTFSAGVHPLGLIPPVPLSGRHVQLERLHVTVEGVTAAVNVTACAPAMLAGAAVTLNCGGVT